MKKNLIVLLVCMIFFTGCSSLCITSNAMSSDESMVQAYTISLENSNLRTYIDVYESQLLYMEMGRTAVEFFIYNFQTGENQSVGHVSDFALKGRSNVMIDDILYFYISTYSDNDIKNVLYVIRFLSNDFCKPTDAFYSLCCIYLSTGIPITTVESYCPYQLPYYSGHRWCLD